MIDINKSGLKIISLISSSKLETEKSNIGFSAFFLISCKDLNLEEKKLLERLIVGSFFEENYRAYISDNNENPIIFSDNNSAYGTLLKEGPSLVKKFQFSLFLESGIMIDPPKGQVINFVKRQEKI